MTFYMRANKLIFHNSLDIALGPFFLKVGLLHNHKPWQAIILSLSPILKKNHGEVLGYVLSWIVHKTCCGPSTWSTFTLH
jgi:hypothetical protein